MAEAAANQARTAAIAKAKTAPCAADPPSAAPGAPAEAAPAAPPQAKMIDAPTPVPLTTMLEMDSVAGQDSHLTDWAATTKAHVDNALHERMAERQGKVPFAVPRDLLLIPPLEIKNAAPGASAFRECMDYDNLVFSFSNNGQYEAAGTVWMLDPLHCSDSDGVSINHLESAM